MKRHPQLLKREKIGAGSFSGGGSSYGPVTWAEMNGLWYSPVMLSVIAVGFLVFAIVVGRQVADTNSKVNVLLPGVVSVPINVSCSTDGGKTDARRATAYQKRIGNAFANYAKAVPCHDNNGDEVLYSSTHFASYSKGMQHDSLGHVSPSSYGAFLKAVNSDLPSDWDAIPLATGATRKFVNPQGGLGYVNEGGDPGSFYVRPAPAFSSAEQAGEIVENYWMALARDVNFADYATNSITQQAVSSIGMLSDFRGPPVAANTLFRGTSPGCSVGPYISQFLYRPCPIGATWIDQRLLPPVAGVDFMKNFSTYLAQQNVLAPEAPLTYGPNPVFIRNGRDLSHWVHVDVLFQAYIHAALILLGTHAPLKPGIPYQFTELNQEGFGTFGPPQISQFSTNSAISALKVAWFQKWKVHRRLRPEVFGARVHNNKTGVYAYPIHDDVNLSGVLPVLNATYGSYLLAQAFPEGSPLHPSYNAGHATVAGAATTMLKAFFNEDYVLTGNLMPNPADGGQTLIPLSPSATLTVGGELNKLANNIAIGRNIAGVHWRSDATESLKLGEKVAISILRDMKSMLNEPFGAWSFRSFEGILVTV
jgi:hypothetical protein